MIGLVSIINNLKPKNMKKLFFVLALVGVITSCKSKKNDEKKARRGNYDHPNFNSH